jgi:HEAT repeat protein
MRAAAVRKSQILEAIPREDPASTRLPLPVEDEPAAVVVIDANVTPETMTAPPTADVGPPPPSLADPSVGFAEFLTAVTSAVARTTYYERGHPEFTRSLNLLGSVMGRPLERRVEITFARRDQHSNELAVMTGWGEMLDLVKAAAGGVGAACAQRLGETFVRRGLVSLTFKEGLDERELGDAVELLSGPEVPPKELQAQFIARNLTKVSILFVAEMLGKERRLPWQVMLCISRIARDLEAVPKMVRAADPDRKKRLRTALIADVTRTLRTPEQVKVLLTNWDLLAESVGASAELASVDIPPALVGSLAHPTLLRVASIILTEMEQGAQAPAIGSGVPPPGANVRQLMQVIGARFIRERTIESDDVLRELHSRAVMSFPELPEDVQLWVLAEQQAEDIAADPEAVLRVLDSVFDLPRYQREMATLSRAMRVLSRRGAAVPLWTVVVRLQQRHARGSPPGDETREGLAARALGELADPEVLAPLATVLLSGPGVSRDSAQGTLVTAGEAGAQALCNVRAQGGDVVRIRFVEAMKELGQDAIKPLSALVLRITGTDGGSEDVALAEDVLRAMPEIMDERLGGLVAGLLKHHAPTVRRAAAAALASPWGQEARVVLLGALEDPDEGVRVTALTGLRKVGVIDQDTVRRIERILTSGAGDNLCAVAAALLGDVVPEAREAAVTILCHAIQPRTRSMVEMFTGPSAPSHESPFVVETMARVLLTIGGDRGREAVKKRASKSSGAIKVRLNAMLETP